MIDNYFRKILPKYLDYFLVLFKKMRLSPNHITFLGFLTAIISAIFLILNYFYLSLLIWWISRLFDAFDGIYARKYNLSTAYGAYLDIVLDMAAYSIMIKV